MVKLPCYNADGTRAEDIEVDPSLFGDKVLSKTLHQMVVGYGHHKRVGTHSAKTRGEIKGSNRKPYRQKGTGRARAGTRKSPLWRSGGAIFPPKPRDYDTGLPKKMRKAALNSALLAKLLDGEVAVIDGLKLEAPHTKTVATLLKQVELNGKPVSERSHLFLMHEYDRNLYLSARNIANTKIEEVRNLNAYDVVRKVNVVLTKQALEALIEQRKRDTEAQAAKASAG